MSEIPLAQLGDFLVLFSDLLFFPPFIEFSMIRQYAHNVLRFTRPILETF